MLDRPAGATAVLRLVGALSLLLTATTAVPHLLGLASTACAPLPGPGLTAATAVPHLLGLASSA